MSINIQSTDLPPPKVQQSASRKSFLRPFGQKSLILAVAAIVIPLILSKSLDAIDTPAEDTGEVVAIGACAMAIVSIGVVTSLAASTLGLLSLLGYGKQDGRSHRFAGLFGLALSGPLAYLWCTVPFATAYARIVAHRHADVPQAAAQGSLLPYHHRETGAQFSKPDDGWMLYVGEQAKELNPAAAAVLLKDADQGKAQRLGILIVEPLSIEPGGKLNYTELTETVVSDMPLDDKCIELNENTQFQGREGARFSVTGKPAQFERLRYTGYIFWDQDHIFQIMAAGRESETTVDDPDFLKIHDALKLTRQR